MAHVIKVERATKDGKKRHAWKVRYRDPDRVERAKTFDKKGDAEKFASTIETDILRGDYVDPRAGASPKAVQSIMGHRSAAFTLTVYGHLFDEDLDALAKRMDNAERWVNSERLDAVEE